MGFTPGAQRFRETLRHEDHIHNQIEETRGAFNRGDLNEITNMVEAILLLITPKMEDAEFKEDLESLDEKWRKELRKREVEYERKIKRARTGSPELIPKPRSKPGVDHWKKVFMIACALFERRGLMLKVNQDDSI